MQRRKFLAGAAAAASVPLIGCATDSGASPSASKQAALASAAGVGLLFTATPGQDLHALFASANAVNGTVYFPASTAAYTWGPAPLVVGAQTSVVGDGRGSILNTSGDGFVLETSGAIGARRIGDFFLQGQHSGTGIAVAGAPRVSGVLFQNLQVDNFAIGIDAVNLWHSTFHQMVVYNCTIGVRIAGQSVANCIAGCKIQVGDYLIQPGTVGVLVEPSGGVRPEDVKITDGTLVFGFDTNVDVRSCLNFALLGSDLDYAGSFGIRLGTVDGGCSINDNYLAAYGGSCTLVSADSLGAVNYAPIAIERNNLNPAAASGGQTGIFLGANRDGLKSVRSNQIQGLATAIKLVGVTGAIIEGNFLQGLTYSEASKDNVYRNNRMDNFQRAAPLAGLDRDCFEANTGGLVTAFHGPVAIDPFVTTMTVPLPINLSYPSYFRIRSHAYQFDGGLSRGRVRALNNYAGGITLELDTAFGIPIADIWLDVEVY